MTRPALALAVPTANRRAAERPPTGQESGPSSKADEARMAASPRSMLSHVLHPWLSPLVRVFGTLYYVRAGSLEITPEPVRDSPSRPTPSRLEYEHWLEQLPFLAMSRAERTSFAEVISTCVPSRITAARS